MGGGVGNGGMERGARLRKANLVGSYLVSVLILTSLHMKKSNPLPQRGVDIYIYIYDRSGLCCSNGGPDSEEEEVPKEPEKRKSSESKQ